MAAWNGPNGGIFYGVLLHLGAFFLKVQYMCCHRVVLEHLRYRYTRIYASKLDATIRRLAAIEPETGRTGWEEEYRVNVYSDSNITIYKKEARFVLSA